MEVDYSFYEVANSRHMFELEKRLMMETVSIHSFFVVVYYFITGVGNAIRRPSVQSLISRHILCQASVSSGFHVVGHVYLM